MAGRGLHHVTLISSDAERSCRFYACFLRMRLVKRTVSREDPGTFHLCFGDEAGRPGTLFTLFPWQRKPRGACEAWQTRRAKEIMHSRLAACLTIADIARECRLTPSYFAKAFRCTTGMSPHQYLTHIRVEAKSLLLSLTLPLADIALICGFGNQSYFTRVFTRSVGTSPGTWRRAMLR